MGLPIAWLLRRGVPPGQWVFRDSEPVADLAEISVQPLEPAKKSAPHLWEERDTEQSPSRWTGNERDLWQEMVAVELALLSHPALGHDPHVFGKSEIADRPIVVGAVAAERVPPRRHESVERMTHEGEDKVVWVPVQHLSEALATQRQIEPGLGKVPKRRGMLAKVKLDRRPTTFRDVDENALVDMRNHGTPLPSRRTVTMKKHPGHEVPAPCPRTPSA